MSTCHRNSGNYNNHLDGVITSTCIHDELKPCWKISCAKPSLLLEGADLPVNNTIVISRPLPTILSPRHSSNARDQIRARSSHKIHHIGMGALSAELSCKSIGRIVHFQHRSPGQLSQLFLAALLVEAVLA